MLHTTVRHPGDNPGTTKNDEGRVLPTYGDMVEVLSLQKQQRDLQWPRCPWVFHRCGRPILEFPKSWEQACVRAGLEDLLFHDLRRSAVQNLTRVGIPEKIAMQITGHKTRSVFDRYNIVSERDIRKAGQRAGRYLAEKDTKTGSIPSQIRGKGGSTQAIELIVVRTGRVELPFPCGSQILSLVRLPIPPRSHWVTSTQDYNNPFSVPQILTSRPISRNVAAFEASARLARSASGA